MDVRATWTPARDFASSSVLATMKEEMNNKVNKVKVANCVNEDKEVITKNNKDLPNEQLAGQVEAPRQMPKWPDLENIKDSANYY